jgi:hypothetical protein
MSQVSPPTPAGVMYRPKNESLTQPYINREDKTTWIYLPQYVKVHAVCTEILDKPHPSFYWDAAELRIKVLEQIRKNSMYIIPDIRNGAK